VREHLAGALVAAVAGGGVAMLCTGSPVGATASRAKTIIVELTERGPSPSPAQLNAGDSVTFVNHVAQPGRTLPLLGAVQNVEVDVDGVAQDVLRLRSYGSSATLTYAQPATVAYTARYTAQLVAGIVPVTRYRTTSGRMSVAPVQPVSSPQPSQANGVGVGAPGPPARSAGRAVSRRPVTDSFGHTSRPAGWGLAGHAVRQGSDSASGGSLGGAVTSARPPVPVTAPRQDAGIPALPALPKLSGSDPSSIVSVEADSGGTGRDGGLGLPAIVAVVLLSVVTAALVRTLIAQRRAA
jgi:hypothetical protein